MLIALIQVLFAAMRTVSRSAVNIMLYSLLSRIFNQWFGFNSLISFICSAFWLSKIVGYFKRLWLNARLKNKKPDEKIVVSELTWQSPTTLSTKSDNPNESADKFENDWTFLLADDEKNLFSSIVNIPFNNGWLFLVTFSIVDYQMNSLNYSYFLALVRTIGCLILLICGSSVRYQTLFDREKKDVFQMMTKQREDVERYIIYSQTGHVPIASVCLQIIRSTEPVTFMVQLYQINSKFDDYIYDVENYLAQRLIERVKAYGSEHETSARLIWSIPTCRQAWTPVLKVNKFVLRYTYKDFSFMPFVNSHVEQYEYLCEYTGPPADPEDAAMKNE